MIIIDDPYGKEPPASPSFTEWLTKAVPCDVPAIIIKAVPCEQPS